LAVIAGDLGIDITGAHTTKLIRSLQAKLIEIHEQGRQVVALIDEAHAMPMETLEEIRLLSNLETSQHKLMQIVLFGQPELDQHLSQPHMRQLKERITHSFGLRPLPPNDIREYLGFRLRAAGYKGPDLFSRDALNLIADASEGLTRRINIYADKTLLAAYAEGTHTITGDHVRAAINDTQIVAAEPRGNAKRQWQFGGAGLAAGLLIGFLLGAWWNTQTPPVQANLPKPTSVSSPSTAPVPAAASPALATQPANTGVSSAADNASNGNESRKPAAAGTPEAPTKALVTSDWLQKRLANDREKLLASGSGRWTIQLMTADQGEQAGIEGYLTDAERVLAAQSIRVYPAGSREKPRIGVVYGDFPSRSAALEELGRLPARIGQYRPYARSFDVIREEMRTSRS
jgi:MSHA biogenesis protein MshM